MAPPIIACPSCGAALLPVTAYNTRQALPCPACQRAAEVYIFPAVERTLSAGGMGTLVTDEEASCFHHPTRRAETHCESCGRFLCSLCDVEMHGQHYCGTCIAEGKRKGTMEALVTKSQRYDRKAIFYGILSFVPYLGMIFVLAALTASIYSLRNKATAPLIYPLWARAASIPLALLGAVTQVIFVLLVRGA